jgi:hypothetical protein
VTLAERGDQRSPRTPDDEERSIAGMVESLVTAFPGVPEQQVRACVEDITAGFASARIRTYVPIFVARRARAELTGRSAPADGAHPG